MPLATQFNEYIDDIDNFLKKLKGNLSIELDAVRNKIREKAPLGITGFLKDSFNTKISTSIEGIKAEVTSNVEYANYQNENRLMHLTENEVGKKSFRDYGKSGWSGSTSPKGMIRKRDKKIGSKAGWNIINYSRGYTLAKEGKVPTITYTYDYVQKAIEELGGIDSIKSRIGL
jgi:hypothetical protein